MAHWPTRISLRGRDLADGQRLVRRRSSAARASANGRWPPVWPALRTPSGSRTRIEARLVDEIEGAGNDVAGRIDHQAGRRAGAEQHLADPLQAADGLDAHHRRRHAIDRRREAPLAPARRCRRPRRQQMAGPSRRRTAECQSRSHDCTWQQDCRLSIVAELSACRLPSIMAVPSSAASRRRPTAAKPRSIPGREAPSA